jgi:hypothetical protein
LWSGLNLFCIINGSCVAFPNASHRCDASQNAYGVTVSELLFSGGLARCFWGSTNQSSANRAPSALRTTHRSNPGTAHPLAAYAIVTLRHSVPSFSTSKTPVFWGSPRSQKKREETPSGPTRA